MNWKQTKAGGVRLYGDIQSHWGDEVGEASKDHYYKPPGPFMRGYRELRPW